MHNSIPTMKRWCRYIMTFSGLGVSMTDAKAMTMDRFGCDEIVLGEAMNYCFRDNYINCEMPIVIGVTKVY